MNSILETIKTMLNIDKAETYFDDELIVNINTALTVLTDLGIGPEEGFRIVGYDETWEDFLGDDKRLESVKSFVHLKTKLIFDPPQSSFVLDSYSKTIAELEWRLCK